VILTLVRHGETDWNRQGRLQGSADVPLNEAGRRQARDRAASWPADRPFDRVLTSPMLRARETADLLAAATGAPVVPVPGLEEMRFGAWETLTWAEVQERHADDYRRWRQDRRFTPPTGGESYDRTARRALGALAPHLAGAPPDTLVVAHGAVLLALVCLLRGLPFEAMDDLRMGNLEVVPAEAAELLRLDAELNRPGPGSPR